MTRRKKGKNSFKSVNEITRQRGVDWFTHYNRYLKNIALQMFEWKNLPVSVDPRYLEMSLHGYGYVCFVKDKNLGYIVSQGSMSGTLNHYLMPTHFHAVSGRYRGTFPIYRYADIKPDNACVVVTNNDVLQPTYPSLRMFAQELANTKQIKSVNLKAQKTPVFIAVNGQMDKLTWLNVFDEYDGNAPAIMVDKKLDLKAMEVFKTDAPYVVDKIDLEFMALWREVMMYLGYNTANTEKKERLNTAEVHSNNEQIEASGNVMLKARKEACANINELYGLDVDVEIRQEVFDDMKAILQNEVGNNVQ
ncbi:upper collar protein [Bacillus phage vB_Bpu_PumA2]|uniref:Upper collar protein n=2 Tax=root TaxID=1 RepID=A0A5Q2W7S1_9CAUD|nr:upper collar connector [Bacillus phage vB_Bpu_PumA2]QGH74237.1 upper collar protein [Bacillus phage vB_Bpu_PumA2]